jgi:hypothetical protein
MAQPASQFPCSQYAHFRLKNTVTAAGVVDIIDIVRWRRCPTF